MIFLYCFIVFLCVYVVSWPYVIYFPTPMTQYSLFVLKVSLNTKQTNKQTKSYNFRDHTDISNAICLSI